MDQERIVANGYIQIDAHKSTLKYYTWLIWEISPLYLGPRQLSCLGFSSYICRATPNISSPITIPCCIGHQYDEVKSLADTWENRRTKTNPMFANHIKAENKEMCITRVRACIWYKMEWQDMRIYLSWAIYMFVSICLGHTLTLSFRNALAFHLCDPGLILGQGICGESYQHSGCARRFPPSSSVSSTIEKSWNIRQYLCHRRGINTGFACFPIRVK